MDITLTNDQQNASEAFTNFLMTEDVEMVISGGAGVGKSTLLSYLIDQFHRHNKLLNILGEQGLDKVVVAATTNKAAAVVADMIGEIVPTIHSLLGLTIYNDHRTGQSKLTKKNWSPNNPDFEPSIENALVIIDECSMIDSELYGWIHSQTSNCKFLYIGDHCQMAPVMESLSPVFKRNLEFFKLNEIIRSKNAPPITTLCQRLRQTVETGTFFEITESPGFIEYLDDEGMRVKLEEHFTIRDSNARVLCYTNKRVNQFNSLIRGMRNLPPEIQVGEILVSNQATIIGSKLGRLSIEDEVTVLGISDETVVMAGCLECIKVETNRGLLLVPKSSEEYHGALKHFSKAKDWTSFFLLKDHIADLRPRDACTVYKAQGSTYGTVFVDIGNIGSCNVPSQTARMLYVACSRPETKIYLYGELPEKYRS